MHGLGTLSITRPLQRGVRCAPLCTSREAISDRKHSSKNADCDRWGKPTPKQGDRNRVVVEVILGKVDSRVARGLCASRVVHIDRICNARYPGSRNSEQAAQPPTPGPAAREKEKSKPNRRKYAARFGDCEDGVGRQART